MQGTFYDAHRVEMQHEMDMMSKKLDRAVEDPVVLAMPDTALRSFERAPEGLKTEFSAWMTRVEKDRLSYVEDVSKRFPHQVEIQRNMNYIIWLESVHPEGSKTVAALAFNRLFQNKEASKKK